MTSSIDIGAPHPFGWPKTNGFHTKTSLDEMVRHLRENKIWNVTEKLDGCNVCLSTEGWMASRNKIISKRKTPKTVFQGVHIKEIETLFTKLDALKDLIEKNFFPRQQLEVLLYGELILNGTGMSKHDVYNYRKRNILPGDIYSFAIGLVIPEGTKLPLIFQNGFFHQGKDKQCYIVPMSFYLSELLHQTHIAHTPLLFTGNLSDIVEIEHLEEKIFQRKLEGYILSGNQGEGLIKWKYLESPSHQVTTHFEDMMDLCKDSIASKGVTMLQELCAISHKFITKLEDSGYDRMLDTYLEIKGNDLILFLDQAKRESSLSFQLALKMKTDTIYHGMKKTLEIRSLLDPTFCKVLKDKIFVELYSFYKNY
jgi:hypothetical protein